MREREKWRVRESLVSEVRKRGKVSREGKKNRQRGKENGE